jgi:SAM-dependent methyltransferase
VPSRLDLFTNRLRANSFGAAARRYDAYRPRYPDEMIRDLVLSGAHRVLDVGAGTGIASLQFDEWGADVLALEPDARMAAVAEEKGIPTEIATFEEWDPAGRTFDLVVFAASFHWVDPALALPKVREILTTRGTLALLWNRVTPTRPTREDFAAIQDDYFDADPPPMDDDSDEIIGAIAAAGFTVTQRTYPRTVRYTAAQWLAMVFTYSNYLTLDVDKAAELRGRLAELIGPEGVTASADALAIVALRR